MASISYRTQGVCARNIDIETKGDTIESVRFHGGCDGNLKAIGILVKGKKIDEVVSLLEDNTCGPKPTSCGDQLARALKTIES